ncbi:ABC transporter substrate-binding protein [Dethiobacter alkaliphilus]|uniref:ABC transporter substrate-binding protein n=1 Tax=Dethiobacter alkaliphilus TaxID=427926 RepID=UPI0022260F30|nr:ABC transporter substrate-binding protein [Dethiobacter alkaliphilus]MCW3490834.1 ABC transporter substrate-binding protein [Dethiobacter alkaliphilus]
MKSGRFLVVFMILVMVAVVFTGCGGQDDLTKVRLNEVTRSVFYAPMYAAINLGYFEEAGIELELTTGQGADNVMTALLSGQADIGFMGPEATIYVYNQGQDDYAVNFAQLTKRDGSFLMAREPDPDFVWDNVRGKSIIGGRPGGMPLMTLEYVLKNQGITPGEDVELITNIQFALMGGAFTGGEGDFVTLFEPVATNLELESVGFVVASVGEDSGEIPYTVFSARKSFLEKNSELVQQFTDAIYRGQVWVMENEPEEIARVIRSSFPDADEEVLTNVARRYKEIDAWADTPVFSEEAFNRMQDVMEMAGELEKRAPYEDLVTNDFALEAIK